MRRVAATPGLAVTTNKERHPGGRPRTGRTTCAFAFRLSLADAELVMTKAARAGLPVSVWLQRQVHDRVLKRREGEGTRKRKAGR